MSQQIPPYITTGLVRFLSHTMHRIWASDPQWSWTCDTEIVPSPIAGGLVAPYNIDWLRLFSNGEYIARIAVISQSHELKSVVISTINDVASSICVGIGWSRSKLRQNLMMHFDIFKFFSRDRTGLNRAIRDAIIAQMAEQLIARNAVAD